MKEIKFVKGVSFEDHRLSVLNINIPRNAVENPAANAMEGLGNPGFKSTGGLHLTGRVFPTLQVQTIS